ncbi:hypothetical protein FOA52_006147 [Chlamydomonas sp. UWO 241]|nr:hypothetical protein FOA52_006147 [Chlamydomonas sp. UWO 241]
MEKEEAGWWRCFMAALCSKTLLSDVKDAKAALGKARTEFFQMVQADNLSPGTTAEVLAAHARQEAIGLRAVLPTEHKDAGLASGKVAGRPMPDLVRDLYPNKPPGVQESAAIALRKLADGSVEN